MSKKVAEIIVEVLEQAGVKHCYGIVGDTLNLIAHHINESDIEWAHLRHEEAGAFAAEGEAMLTGNLTAVAGSCGPGSLHFINGLVGGVRQRQAWIYRHRAEVRRHAPTLYGPAKPGLRQGRRGDRILGAHRVEI